MYGDIKCFVAINDTDSDKVAQLVASMLANGWQGAPILYVDGAGLVTGSHRLEALKRLEEMYDDADESVQAAIESVLDADIALDVTEIVCAYCEENECSFDDLDFSSLRSMFEGTEVEQYSSELEW